MKVKELIDSVEEEDLYRMKMDLLKGGGHLKKLVEEKIREYEARKSGYCITCGKDVSKNAQSFTLIFGSESFRKKAIFCEIDCLEYFLGELKKIRGKKHAIQKVDSAV